MALRVYNTLTKQKDKFVPANEKVVSMFNCGPTVFSIHTHLGNLRSYTFSDLVKRYLKYKGYNVKHTIKITDVDDHTIKESLAAGVPIREYTEKYLKDFEKQLNTLNCLKPDYLPRVTDYIPEIVEEVIKLGKHGLTYASNNSTYFRISKVPNYGVLVNHQKSESLRKNAGHRMEDFLFEEKENTNDFCLWKAWHKEEGSVFWDTEIGKGRPGWHLECSVMARKLLGDCVDIHIGGISHIFPHHTNEIAIAEAITKKQFVNYWMHHDFLFIDGKQMSKKKNRFYLLKDILDRGESPYVLRLTLLKTHYRQRLNFTWKSMKESETLIRKTSHLLFVLERIKNNKIERSSFDDLVNIITDTRKGITEGMDNDINISIALDKFFSFLKLIRVNIGKFDSKNAEDCISFISEIDAIFGVFKKFHEVEKRITEEKIAKLKLETELIDRANAKANKDYDVADKITKKIENLGFKFTDVDNISVVIANEK